ncbi:unnamed protein product [Medioppia subpectinata]|uniref:Uncharacterized protein n=1 Tax=Medioppia subpectinata TaxID=1979941 RepID=A0A7R9KNN7_9ACAR|nr:unnamed protein product [Medioppia subpectinata]CAG2105919.1 unnamed protein product [Medioppia subpectinata]
MSTNVPSDGLVTMDVVLRRRRLLTESRHSLIWSAVNVFFASIVAIDLNYFMAEIELNSQQMKAFGVKDNEFGFKQCKPTVEPPVDPIVRSPNPIFEMSAASDLDKHLSLNSTQLSEGLNWTQLDSSLDTTSHSWQFHAGQSPDKSLNASNGSSGGFVRLRRSTNKANTNESFVTNERELGLYLKDFEQRELRLEELTGRPRTSIICMVAAILGAVIFGMIADRCGRRNTLLVSLYLFVSAAVSLHFVTDFLQFSILYSLQAFFAAGMQITAFVLLLELFATPYQLRASLYWTCFSMTAVLLVPLLMWSIRNWRYVQLAISVPCIAFFTYIWLLPQSPLWLVVEGRLHTAENLIERLAQHNGKHVSPSFRLHLQNLLSCVKSSSVCQSLRHRILPKFSSPGLRWHMFVHFYLFFVVALTAQVTEPQTIRLNENRYAHHFYHALMDLGAVMLLYHFAVRIGPRFIQAFVFIISGLMLMTSITLQEILPKTYDTNGETNHFPQDFDFRLLLLPSSLILMARTLAICLPALTWFHAAKTMPTGIRCVGLAACFSWSKIGQMAAPHLLVLAQLIAPFIPIGLCGSLSVVAGGLSLLLPTCYRKPLPNTIEEAENKRLPVQLKHRYPSYRDLKDGKISSIPISGTNTLNGNVYTIGPNGLDKTNVKHHTDGQHMIDGIPGSGGLTVLPAPHRPNTVYNDDTDSRLSDLEEDINESNNWRLFANELSRQSNAKMLINRLDSYDGREVDLLGRSSAMGATVNGYPNGLTHNMGRIGRGVDPVAETNL